MLVFPARFIKMTERLCMKKLMSGVLVCAALVTSAWAESGEKERERLKESSSVMKEILDTPDKGIPKSVMDEAKCVIVLPAVKKAAVGIGGSYGRGAMTCRTGEKFDGAWSPPVMMASSGGSFGFQIGG